MQDHITIRKASLDDIPDIQALADVVFRSTYKNILSPEQMDYMMEWMYSTESLQKQINPPEKVFLLAEYDGSFCGYASYEFETCLDDGRKQFHLQKLYVLPACQGRGVGKALLGKVIEILSELSPEGFRMELNVNRNNAATGFYEHLGLYRDRQGDFPIGKGFYMNDYIYALDV